MLVYHCVFQVGLFIGDILNLLTANIGAFLDLVVVEDKRLVFLHQLIVLLLDFKCFAIFLLELVNKGLILLVNLMNHILALA